MTDPASQWEANRVAALCSYEILDTPPDGAFERVTAPGGTPLRCAGCLASLVDEERIWFKSRYGLDADQIPRSPGLCASVIFSDSAYVVKNAIEDPRTLANLWSPGTPGSVAEPRE